MVYGLWAMRNGQWVMDNGLPPKCGEIIKVKDGPSHQQEEEIENGEAVEEEAARRKTKDKHIVCHMGGVA